MKKIILLLLMVLCFAITANSATAVANIYTTPSIIDFGEVDWGESNSQQFIITNNGTENLTNVTLSSTAIDDYNIIFSESLFNLSINENKTITVEMTLDDDPEENTGNMKIGEVTISSQYNTDIDMYVTAPERFQITDLDVMVGSQSDTNLEDGAEIEKKAKPGDSVEFSIELENLFDSDDDKYDIEEIKVEITIKGIDDGDDFEEETEEFMINAGDKKTKTITFDIPELVESNTYEVIINVEADNTENNDKYAIEWNLELEVEKKAQDIQINKYELMPSTLECGESQTNLMVELLNLGEKEEDEITIEIRNSDLNLNERYEGIYMGKDFDNDAEYQKNINIMIEEEFADPGIYQIIVRAYFDNDKLDDEKIAELEIKACAEQETDDEDTEEEQKEINETIEEDSEEPTDTITENIVPDITISNGNQGFKDSPYFFPVMGFVIILGLIMITVLIILIKRE